MVDMSNAKRNLLDLARGIASVNRDQTNRLVDSWLRAGRITRVEYRELLAVVARY